ncbi:dual specificity protein phosphatase 18 isoform X2 [Microtus ochrogaster]|uniref:Dual specificity protein phosphatase 18 isoform X2 n=1 Tax=Microtus ochrogaster TaxID=79684 RepID=A0ABM1AV09_MICOH|nr:dual specificity protein phosphatase 18 isoform X2 [Microtus ochrogaster]
MTSPLGAFAVQFPQPSISGLSQITKSLFISNGVAANNKLLLSSNQITTVINVSVEGGDEAGPHPAALCCWCEPLRCLVPRLPHEIPRHDPSRCPHVDQIMPAHHSTQQWLLGAAHPL